MELRWLLEKQGGCAVKRGLSAGFFRKEKAYITPDGTFTATLLFH